MGEQLVYFCGKIMPLSEAKLPVMDHACLYGDGVFEGIRAYNGYVFKLTDHVKRLYNSAKAIRLEIPMSKAEMEKVVTSTCAANNLTDCYIRLVVTRGGDNLGLMPNKEFPPRVFCIAGGVKLYSPESYQNGLHAKTTSFRRNNALIVDPQIKSLNYLNSIQAVMEAAAAGFEEAVFLNADGIVCEGSGDNIFIVKDNVLITPPTYLGTLDGITRQNVMKVARDAGYEVREEPFTLFNMFAADEAFLTGTAAEAIALTEVDDRKIGNGQAGPVTMDVLSKFRKYARDPKNGTKIE